jgi:maltose alpha-D-glucosyltransferase/alpha-amylase
MSQTRPENAPAASLPSPWGQMLSIAARASLAETLLGYVRPRRWFRAKARDIQGAHIADVLPLDDAEAARATHVVVVLEIAYQASGAPRDLYVVPLARVDLAAAESLRHDAPHAILGTWPDGALVDGLASGLAANALLALVRGAGSARGEAGTLRGESSATLESAAAGPSMTAAAARGEQTNSTLVFGDRLLMKIYRQIDRGPSPELEVGRFLTRHCQPPCAPRVVGALSYQRDGEDPRVLGVVHEFLANDGDAWSMAARELRATFAAIGASTAPAGRNDVAGSRFARLAETLGRRTAELHRALAQGVQDGHDGNNGDDAAFQPEPLTAGDRAAQATRIDAMLTEHLATLAHTIESLPAATQALARPLLLDGGAARQAIAAILARFRDEPLDVVKTRIHGDLHLGQVLCRGDDFVIIDFEGEPARPLDERRAKSSPLRDVMGMVRSFDYAPEAALREADPQPIDGDHRKALQQAAATWTRAVTDRYLGAYRAAVAGAAFMPHSPQAADQLSLMLTFYELEKVVYELGYELHNRPDWVEIPLRGLARIAQGEPPR